VVGQRDGVESGGRGRSDELRGTLGAVGDTGVRVQVDERVWHVANAIHR